MLFCLESLLFSDDKIAKLILN